MNIGQLARAYLTFLRSLTHDPDKTDNLVGKSFYATVDRERFNLPQLLEEAARMRRIFPDFGDDMRNAHYGAEERRGTQRRITVTYQVVCTTSGQLVDRTGRTVDTPAGNKVTITYQDRVTFDSAMLVISVESTTDQHDVLNQILRK